MVNTPWDRAQAQRRSLRQEETFGKRPGARPQVNSGRLWFSKRDNTFLDFLVENRTVEKETTKSYTISVKELKKLAADAVFHHRLPAMNIEFPFDYENWTLIRTSDFDAMCERLLTLEGQVEDLSRLIPEDEEDA